MFTPAMVVIRTKASNQDLIKNGTTKEDRGKILGE